MQLWRFSYSAIKHYSYSRVVIMNTQYLCTAPWHKTSHCTTVRPNTKGTLFLRYLPTSSLFVIHRQGWWQQEHGDDDDDDGQPVESQPSSPSYTGSGPWQEGTPQDHTPPPSRMTMMTFGGFVIVKRMISTFKVVMMTFGKITIFKRIVSPPDPGNKTLSVSTESHLWKPTHT